MKETTYFTTRYPNGDETFHTKDCEYTTLDALEEALKVAKFLPIGSASDYFRRAQNEA